MHADLGVANNLSMILSYMTVVIVTDLIIGVPKDFWSISLAVRAQRGEATLSSCQLRFSIYVSIVRASQGQRSSCLPHQQNLK